MNLINLQQNSEISKLFSQFKYFFGYLVVGGLNLVVTGIVYWILLRILFFGYEISFSISWLLGVVFTYILNFLYVFKPAEKIEFKNRLLKYVIVYLLSLLFNIIVLRFGVETMKFDPLWFQFILIPGVVLINYFGIKKWALKRKKKFNL